jgi:PAT family beta-lactamase induction signal transducer AmpG
MLVFALTFFYSRPLLVEKSTNLLGTIAGEGGLMTFLVEGTRFFLAILFTFLAARLLVQVGLVKMELLERSYILPIKDLFNRFGLKAALLMVLLIGFYRVSDIVMGVIANVFYTDLGFSKTVIAGITKTFGLIMTLLGGFLGGMLTMRFGVYRILFLGAALAVGNSLLFMLLSLVGNNVYFLSAVIAADNLSAGIATTAFVAYLSGLTSISFTAVQYAIFSSLMTLFPKLIGGYSGTIIGVAGYKYFFLMTATLGVPVLLLIVLVKKQQEKVERGRI